MGTSKRSLPSTSYSDLEEVCRSSSRLSLVRPSPLRLRALTLLNLSRKRSRTRKVFQLTNKDSSLLVSNLMTTEPSLTTTSKRSPPSTSCSVSEEVTEQLATG